MDTLTSLREVTELNFVGALSAKGGLKRVRTKSAKKEHIHQLKLRMKVCFLILGVRIRSMKEAVVHSALSSARVWGVQHTLVIGEKNRSSTLRWIFSCLLHTLLHTPVIQQCDLVSLIAFVSHLNVFRQRHLVLFRNVLSDFHSLVFPVLGKKPSWGFRDEPAILRNNLFYYWTSTEGSLLSPTIVWAGLVLWVWVESRDWVGVRVGQKG